MSSLWLLEAKRHTTEDRSDAACSVRVWLKPGTVFVGRQGQAEVAVEEDKSISRRHAELTVPPPSAEPPHVLITDRSKYGTWVATPTGDTSAFTDDERLRGGEPARVPPNAVVRFGFKSPFRLYHQDWVLYLSPAQREAAAPDALAALEAAAAAAGLPLTGELPNHAGTRVLALAGAPLRVDGPVLLALLRGYPAVGSGWVLAWGEQQVWRNARPQEAAHPVQLQYPAEGGLKALPGPAALLGAAQRQILAGHTLLWLPHTRDAALQEVARLLGAACRDVPASGRGAAAGAQAAGAVAVLRGGGGAPPTAFKGLPWTTYDLLLAGILEGSLEAAVRPPGGEGDATPPGKAGGRGKQGTGRRSASGSGGRGRGWGRGGPRSGDEPQDSGSETDASDDSSHLRGTQRVLAPDGASPSAAGTAGAAARQQQQQQQQQAAQVEEEAPRAAATAAGRKRRLELSQQQWEEQQEGQGQGDVQATPTKRRRQADSQLPAAAAEPPAPPTVRSQPLPVLPAADGWRTMAHSKQHEATQAVPAAGSGAAGHAPHAAPAAKPKTAAGCTRGRPVAAPEAAPPEADGSTAAAGGEAAADEAADVAGASLVTYLPLVVAAPPPARLRGAGGGAPPGCLPDFKAFRKADGGVAAAVGRTLVALAAEPYADDAPPDAEAFLRSEAERRRRAQHADELFGAEVRAAKAAPLPDPDAGGTPPKGRGRGRGGEKAAAAAAPGQRSMLSFLPPAGTARGRGRGRSKKA